MLGRRFQRGDTLIEVLFAVSVFSLVVVGALSIMNQGTAASQRALEITLVRQQLDAQAETLRFMHDSYVAAYQPGITFNTSDGSTTPAEEWSQMLDYIKAVNARSASPLNSGGATCPTPPTGSFVLDPRNVEYIGTQASLQPAQTFAQVTHDTNGVFTGAQGLWVEAVRSIQSADSDQSNTGYIDFHLRACWDSSGLPVPLTLGTIVRLYEPRG